MDDLTPVSSLTALTRLELRGNSIADLTLLAGLTNLETLSLGQNLIVDIGPLASLTSLSELNLGDNQITDLSPLVQNTGIDDGDILGLVGNPIDCTAEDANLTALRNRGVNVNIVCP
jgi:internalin A